MTRFLLLAVLLLLPLTGCGQDTCGKIEEELERCDLPYYGDDNCELLLERCTDDDRVVVEAMFECLGNRCEDGAPVNQCDVHFNRLSQFCQEDLTVQ